MLVPEYLLKWIHDDRRSWVLGHRRARLTGLLPHGHAHSRDGFGGVCILTLFQFTPLSYLAVV